MSPSPPHSIEKCWIFSQDSLVASSDRSAVTFRTCQLDLVTVKLVGLSPALRPVAWKRSVDTMAPHAEIAKAEVPLHQYRFCETEQPLSKTQGATCPSANLMYADSHEAFEIGEIDDEQVPFAKIGASSFLSDICVSACLEGFTFVVCKVINYVGETRKQIISNKLVTDYYIGDSYRLQTSTAMHCSAT